VDPVTHALVGASAARVALGRPLGHAAWLPGMVGALLPDVDAFVRSSSDPLLYAEFHRHVTHALAFIPIGGLVAASPWLLRRRTRKAWPAWIGAATAGYATHGVLDASTTYGTSLLWPFSDTRVSWNIISIVDPVFTAIVALGVVLALWRRTARPAGVALLVALAWLAGGVIQRERALDIQTAVAASRGHAVDRRDVFPGFGTTMVWRSIYEADGRLHLDRLRVPWTRDASWRPGPTVRPFDSGDLPPAAAGDARLVRDIGRFRRFSNGWVAHAPGEPDLVADARYSDARDRFEPVWAIRLRPGHPVPVDWVDRSRQRRLDTGALWAELAGRDPDHRPVPGRAR
jgi:inner membrane protein